MADLRVGKKAFIAPIGGLGIVYNYGNAIAIVSETHLHEGYNLSPQDVKVINKISAGKIRRRVDVEEILSNLFIDLKNRLKTL